MRGVNSAACTAAGVIEVAKCDLNAVAIETHILIAKHQNLRGQSVLMSKGAGEFAICVRLSQQCIGLGLEGLHGIGTSGEAGWRFVESGKMNECVGELGRVAPLLPVHAAPSGDDLPGLFGVVADVRLGVGGRVATQEFSAEETRLD